MRSCVAHALAAQPAAVRLLGEVGERRGGGGTEGSTEGMSGGLSPSLHALSAPPAPTTPFRLFHPTSTWQVSKLIFSGIAGGIDPTNNIGAHPGSLAALRSHRRRRQLHTHCSPSARSPATGLQASLSILCRALTARLSRLHAAEARLAVCGRPVRGAALLACAPPAHLQGSAVIP